MSSGIKDREVVLAQLRKVPIVEFACGRSGISRATFYRWKKESPEFAEAIDDAMRDGIELMNELGESQLISLIKEKKFAAIQFWLRNRHPTYKAQGPSISAEPTEVTVIIPSYAKDGDNASS